MQQDSQRKLQFEASTRKTNATFWIMVKIQKDSQRKLQFDASTRTAICRFANLASIQPITSLVKFAASHSRKSAGGELHLRPGPARLGGGCLAEQPRVPKE